MNPVKRFFGLGKNTPAPSLDDATKKVNERGETLDSKIKKLDEELFKYREQMKRMRPGPAQNGIRQRAMRVLKQKKMFENQRDQLMSQSFNMEQANFATQSMKDTATTVAAMKDANKTMKSQFKEIKINDVENVFDEMQDLLEDANEVNDLLARSFATPYEVDEADLDEELAALGDELDVEVDSVPSYLQTAPVPTNDPRQDNISLPSVPQELTATTAPVVKM